MYSQRSCKVSVSSSSDLDNIADLYYPGAQDDDDQNHMANDIEIHDGCEKRIGDLKELLENIQDKYKIDLETLKSECEIRLSQSVCKICRKNLTNGEDQEGDENYFTEKIKELGNKFSVSNLSKDLELKVYEIKEEVRKEYENELDKIREEIVAKELKRKDEEINIIKSQLNEAHKIEVEKLWRRYEDLANKEVENSVIRVKNEVTLSQDLDEKAKLIEQLKNDKKELLKKQRTLSDQKQKDAEHLKTEMSKAYKKETENMKQAFQIELSTRIQTVLEERAEMEDKFRRQIEKLQEEVNRLSVEKENWQDSHNQNLGQLTDDIRREILRALELQIKAMVASGDEGEDKSQWPPELVALEHQFTSKYQHQLAELVKEHALEIADIKGEYDAKLSELVQEFSIKQAEEVAQPMTFTGDENVDKIVRERNNFRNLAQMLRQVVCELTRYLTSCEDELNNSIMGYLNQLPSSQDSHKASGSEEESSEYEEDQCVRPSPQRKVHFAPDVSSIVSLVEDECLQDCLEGRISADVSVHLRSELESCLARLKGEAAAVLGLSQGREKGVPTTVEDRRLTSVTRQLIEEKKAKEEANCQLRSLQDLVNKYEQELNEAHRELADTKERMIKEKVTVETELNQRQAEEKYQKFCLLQEKARNLVGERGDCPPQWLGLIEELCVEGDALIEEAHRTRDELMLEIEAADKQLRSTRAFLEDQATEREQERDDFTKEIARLTEQLRDRDRDWTSHRQFSNEVEGLEQQVQEMSELQKITEEEKTKMEQELKAAIDKIWVLRDIISELEVQVSSSGQRETSLDHQLAELQAQVGVLSREHADVLQELQTLRDCGSTQALQQEVARLQEQVRKQGSPVVRQIRSQLRRLNRSLDKPIKELEAVNIHVSNNSSLSSPTEDVSIREQLEALRCATPEDKTRSPPSPVHIEEISQLNDKLTRYSRAAENAIKKLTDRDMELDLLRHQLQDALTERDVLQGQSERHLLQLATLRNRVEELRMRNERDMQASAAPLCTHILELEKQVADLTDQLNDSQRKVNKLKQRLEHSEAVVQNQEAELSSLSDHQHQLVLKLNEDLAVMRQEKQHLQAMVEKYRTEDNVSFPQLIEVMLAEKNADIDQLQLRVEELQTQQEHVGSKSQSGSQQYKSRGFRVSFADQVVNSQLSAGERARDVNHHDASVRPYFSTPLSSLEEGSRRLIPKIIGEDISKIPEPSGISLNTSPNRVMQLEGVLSQLKSELEQKSQRLLECEAQLQELPGLEQELTKTKEELMATVKAVSEDKHFYEEQLKTLRQTQEQLARREKELRSTQEELDRKEEDCVRTTADIRALQVIIDGLQQKLKEAKSFAESSQYGPKDNKYREECDTYTETIIRLEKQVSELQRTLTDERGSTRTLRGTIEKLEGEKQDVLTELVTVNCKCQSLKEELETALSNVRDSSDQIESLKADLEASTLENKKLSANCQKLKREMEKLSKKQKTEIQNILKKDSEEALKVKEELESLKSSNSSLQLECEQLKQELTEVGVNLELMKELNSRDNKIQRLEEGLKQLDKDNKTLKEDKINTEQSLNSEISELKNMIDDLNKNIVSLETESKQSQDGVKDREQKETLARRYEVLKREYDRQRRARRESEKKCCVLRDELTKEKRFSARFQNEIEKREPRLEITRSSVIDISPEGPRLTNSLDDLADEVQKELNASAQLDNTLISSLQSPESSEVGRSDAMPPRTDHLRSRLAEVETALHVEQVVVSELRARLAEERARYLEQRVRAHDLAQEVTTLHTINDQFQDKFNSIAQQLEQQVSEVKQLRQTMQPDDGLREKQKLKKQLEESERRVDELLRERVFTKNQLLYLREELAKVYEERDVALAAQRHGHGESQPSSAMCIQENLQQVLKSKSEELKEEQKRSATLQKMVDQANLGLERQTHQLAEAAAQVKDLREKIDDLKRQLTGEVGIRRTLESKIKAMESAERSRYSRRKATEEKLKEELAQAEKTKKELERECLGLRLKLKHTHLQLTAHTAESPLSLRLMEANMAVERLVGEKEDLHSANVLLKEEKQELKKKVSELEDAVEELKSRIHALNIKVTDGGVDNVNAMFAAEREVWLKEKEMMRRALTQRQVSLNGMDSLDFSNAAHILRQYLQAESHRKALVWQKRYLLVKLQGYEEQERLTIAVLYRNPVTCSMPRSPERRFRLAVWVVRAVSRLQFIVEHRRRSHHNTCRLLQNALNKGRVTCRPDNVPELQTLWRKPETSSSSSVTQPGTMSQCIDQFNSIQDRIKHSLSTAS